MTRQYAGSAEAVLEQVGPCAVLRDRRRRARRAPCAGRPGGSTSSSCRIRPDDPPSSATVTTAVRSSVSSRSADSDACSPCPPPSATALGWSARHVRRTYSSRPTMRSPGPGRGGRRWPDAARAQPLGELLGHHDRAVLAAGAADRQGEVALALAAVAGADDLEDSRRNRRGSAARPAGRGRSREPRRPGRSGRAVRGSSTGSAGTARPRRGRRRRAGRT